MEHIPLYPTRCLSFCPPPPEGVAVVKFMGVQLLFCAHDKGPDASHVWRYKFPFTEECLGDDEDTKPVFDVVIN